MRSKQSSEWLGSSDAAQGGSRNARARRRRNQTPPAARVYAGHRHRLAHCLRALVAREQTSKQTKNPRNKQTNPRNGRLSGTGGTAHFSPVKLLQTNRRAARHHAERTLPCMPFYEVAGRCSFACALGSKLATAIVRAARGRARRQWAGPRCAFRGCATGAPRRIIATSIAPIT